MNIKKLFTIFIIIALILPTFCFADDFLEESELDNFIEVSTNVSETKKEPTTHSKL